MNLSSSIIREEIIKKLNTVDLKIDYVEVVDFSCLKRVDEVRENVLIAVAVVIGGVRLIDNLIV